MQIEETQAQLIMDISLRLRKLGINVGYISKEAAFLNDETEFILREPTSEYDVVQLLHKDDIIITRDGNVITSEVKRDLKNDDQVEAMMETINEAMMDGIIYCDPGVTREVEGFGTIEIVQRDLTEHPSIGQFLYELPLSGPRGNVWNYEAIDQYSENDKRFAVCKKIIDEVWPEEQARLLRKRTIADAEEADKQVEAEEERAAVKPTQAYLPSKLMRDFKKWLGLQ